MNPTNCHAFFIFSSPAGSTHRVAWTLARRIESAGIPITLLDLADTPDIDSIAPRLRDPNLRTCLLVGSPVYAAHPVPPLMAFISKLPRSRNWFSVPFITWGAVTSGVALYELGSALAGKGYPLLGAVKVTVRHSLMWAENAPLGADRPNGDDDHVVEDFAEHLAAKLRVTSPAEIPLADLDYQAPDLRQQMFNRSFEAAKAGFPSKKIDESRCTLCGICGENCPVGAIVLSDTLQFSDACIHCFNCVRLCPESAITADLKPIHAFIRQRAGSINESTRTQVFI